MKLTKIESKVLALFKTNRNEDGRVQVWTIPECKAAWSLAKKGLVNVEGVISYSSKLDRGAYGRWQGGMTTHEQGSVNVRLK